MSFGWCTCIELMYITLISDWCMMWQAGSLQCVGNCKLISYQEDSIGIVPVYTRYGFPTDIIICQSFITTCVVHSLAICTEINIKNTGQHTHKSKVFILKLVFRLSSIFNGNKSIWKAVW